MATLAADLPFDLGGDGTPPSPPAAQRRFGSPASKSDYGVDVQALDDLPDPEVLCAGAVNFSYAQGRRLITPTGALQAIGETEDYDSIDVRDWLGKRDATSAADLEAQAQQVQSQDERVATSDVQVTQAAGVIRIQASGTGATGQFDDVLSVDGVSASLLRGG